MTALTRCRAKNPTTCTDPNCPQRQHERAVSAAQAGARAVYRKSVQPLDLGTVSSEGYWHITRMAVNFRDLMQPSITPAARREAQKIIQLEDKGEIDMGEASNEVYQYAEELSTSIRSIINAG